MENKMLAKMEMTESKSTFEFWSADNETYPFFDKETIAYLDEETIEILIEDKIATGG